MQALCYPRPDEFIPERFLRGSEDPISRMNPVYGMLPFGFGRRNCIAKNFATLGIQVLIVKMLQVYRIEYHHEPMGQGMVLDKPFRFKLINRSRLC